MIFKRLPVNGAGLSDAGQGRRKARRTLFRPAIDALVALTVFFVIACAFACGPLLALPNAGAAGAQSVAGPKTALQALAEPGPAPVIEIATAPSADAANAVYRRTSVEAAFGLMALAFAVVVALNLAVLRHVRHAYARRPTAAPRLKA